MLQPPSEFLIRLERVQTLLIERFEPFIGRGLELGQLGLFCLGQATLMTLVDQKKASCIQLAPGLGLIGKLRCAAEHACHPFLK